MLEAMVMGKGRALANGKDGNVDAALQSISNQLAVGSTRNGAIATTMTSSTSLAIGYYAGQILIVSADGVQALDALGFSNLGWVKGANNVQVPGQVIPLNSSSHLYRQYLFFGLGRAAGNGVIRRYDMANKSYYTYPTAPVNTGAIYADDSYLYIFAGVGPSGLATNVYYRIAHGGTSWQTMIIGSGAFTHGVAGGEATLWKGRIYITGGGSRIANTDGADGGSYTVVEYYDMAANTVGRITIDNPGIFTSGTTGTDQPTCVWNDNVYYAATGTAINAYPLTGAAKTTITGPTTGYHCPCMRVGDLFYYLQGYNTASINRLKLPGGL